MGSVCKLLEGPHLEALAPEIAEKLGLGLRCGAGVVGGGVNLWVCEGRGQGVCACPRLL